jgi:protein translocase SecG subunit
MGFWSTFLLIVIIVDAVLMTIVILMQNKGGGVGILGGAASQTAFGNRGGDVLTRTTSIMAGVFIAGSLILALIIAHQGVPDTDSKEVIQNYETLQEDYPYLFDEAPQLERSDELFETEGILEEGSIPSEEATSLEGSVPDMDLEGVDFPQPDLGDQPEQPDAGMQNPSEQTDTE